MTSPGKKHFISHPGYGRAEVSGRNYGFVFSENIEDWMALKGTYRSNKRKVEKERVKE